MKNLKVLKRNKKSRKVFFSIVSLTLFFVIVQPTHAGFFSELGTNITGSLTQIGRYVADGMDVVSNSVISLGKKAASIVAPVGLDEKAASSAVTSQNKAENKGSSVQTSPQPSADSVQPYAPQFRAVTTPSQGVQNSTSPTTASPLLKVQASTQTTKKATIKNPTNNEVVIYTNKSTSKQADELIKSSSGAVASSIPSTLSLSDLKVTGIVDFTGAQVKGFQQVINNILGGGTSPNIVFYNS
ncbi:MAG: hypothetical protein HY981_01235, partial [Candidatus Magasanikbacteria bacterium]|nr:hypothetical protein [Candidatus Magasanikbacteria bacterium]